MPVYRDHAKGDFWEKSKFAELANIANVGRIRNWPAPPQPWLSDITDAKYTLSDMMNKIINENMAIESGAGVGAGADDGVLQEVRQEAVGPGPDPDRRSPTLSATAAEVIPWQRCGQLIRRKVPARSGECGAARARARLAARLAAGRPGRPHRAGAADLPVHRRDPAQLPGALHRQGGHLGRPAELRRSLHQAGLEVPEGGLEYVRHHRCGDRRAS